ncbi:hypothetical protein [Ruminococcus sp.]|uniref:hypothetical protein n=1 Tax=Ruminococcus sp. TaxID=41978 RepID=UPI0026011F94|nr:hypothetical protein [Ruminococcus sp.]MBQ8966293.1 hypothetical protein [Ruminococcus sp.]
MPKKTHDIYDKLAFIFIGIPLGLLALLIAFFVVREVFRVIVFDHAESKPTGDGVKLVTTLGTHSMGSQFSCNIYGDAVVLEDDKEISKGFLTGTSIKRIYTLKAVSPGTALAVVEQRAGGSYCEDCSIYKITVDEDLVTTYEVRESECFYVWANRGAELQTHEGDTLVLTGEQADKLEVPYCGHYSEADEEVPQEGLYKLRSLDSDYSFDLENGKIYSWNKPFLLDEELLPCYREIFEKLK